MNNDQTEMSKLRKMLSDAGIEHEYELLDEEFGYCIKVPDYESCANGEGYSVTSHLASYGGKQGLLEVWERGKDPVGYLAAEEAFEMIANGTVKKND